MGVGSLLLRAVARPRSPQYSLAFVGLPVMGCWVCSCELHVAGLRLVLLEAGFRCFLFGGFPSTQVGKFRAVVRVLCFLGTGDL